MNWSVIRTIMRKDLTAVRRSKAVMLPMMLVPTLLLVVLPLVLALVASRGSPATGVALRTLRKPAEAGSPSKDARIRFCRRLDRFSRKLAPRQQATLKRLILQSMHPVQRLRLLGSDKLLSRSERRLISRLKNRVARPGEFHER